jgi:hypothetical protein
VSILCPFVCVSVYSSYSTHSEFSPLRQNASSKKLFLFDIGLKKNANLIKLYSTEYRPSSSIKISTSVLKLISSPHSSKIFSVFLNFSRQILYSCFSLSNAWFNLGIYIQIRLEISLFDQDLRLMSLTSLF